MKMEIKIRKARLSDLKEIQKLNLELFKEEYKKFDKTLDVKWPLKNLDYFRKSILNKNSFAMVALLGNCIVGYFIGSILIPQYKENYRLVKRMAEIDDSYILPTYQRKGIGSKFVKEFINWAKKKRATRIKAIVSAQNKSSINFHKKNKFNEYAIILERNLK